MPAVTVDNLLLLPRVPEPPVEAAERPVKSVTTAPRGFEGEGFPVRRAFQGVPLTDLDPFVHLDQMGEVEYAPGEPKGTPWHPHRGFETVTYMIDGTFEHQDSNGGGGVIRDGATQWMTAGAGILHDEMPTDAIFRSGGLFHGIQLWVNLPAARKFAPPRYQDIRPDRLSLLTSADGGTLIRVIAGSFAGHDGPGVTYTPIGFGKPINDRLNEHPDGKKWLRRQAQSAWEIIKDNFEDDHSRCFMLWMAFQTVTPPEWPMTGRLAYSLVWGRQRWSWATRRHARRHPRPRRHQPAVEQRAGRALEHPGGLLRPGAGGAPAAADRPRPDPAQHRHHGRRFRPAGDHRTGNGEFRGDHRRWKPDLPA